VLVDIYALVENCGWFDENFYPAYFEDNDMFYRMALAGQKSYLTTEYGFYHKQSATCETVVTKDMWNYCEGYYRSKWGGYPGEEIYTHPFNNKNNKIDHWVKGRQ
jgi:GT2 family glycosyltransferase